MNFRTWCQEKWFEHKEEVYTWEGFYPSASAQEYFSKYRWWLRREYRAVVAKEQRDRELDLRTRVLLDLE